MLHGPRKASFYATRLLAAAAFLACGAGLADAQPAPNPASDADASACLSAALRVRNPERKGVSIVENATMRFDTGVVDDVFTRCRAALARFPTDRDIIVAHYNAAEFMSLLLFGLEYPESDRARHDLAVKQSSDPSPFASSMDLFIASAYEYGLGVERDESKARLWYAKAAVAGNKIAARERDRLGAGARKP